MRKLTSLLILVLMIASLDARGGGRGGRGGGGGGRSHGGAYHGGRVMNRTPSMSRAPRSNVQRRSVSNRQDVRNQVNKYARNRPQASANRQDQSGRAQRFSNNRRNQIAQNRQFSDRATDRIRRSSPNSNHWFDRDFFDRHHIDVGYRGYGANWWRPAAWGTLATWGAWNWATPYYYDNGGYSYPVASTEYTSYAYQDTPTQGSDWLPLGVFAVGSTAEQAANSDRIIQLAINKNGEIDGVLYNSASDQAQDLTGMVDQQTQRAYWSLSNRPDSPIVSTGIYNLTEDETPINVHFSDGTDQTWTLVRIQQ